MRSLLVAAAALPLVAVAAAQPAQGPCMKATERPALVALERGKVKYCFDHGKSFACYAIDLGDGSLWVSAAPRHDGSEPPETPANPDEPRVEIGDTDVKVCMPHSTECKPFKPFARVAEGSGLTGAVNASGTRMALANGTWVETFDVRTGKRLARFKSTKAKDRACTFVDFAGDTLLVEPHLCGDPANGEAWLASWAGKRLATVGGKLPILVSRHVRLDDKQWAFASRHGDAVAIHDVKSGKLMKRIAIGPPTPDTLPIVVAGADEDTAMKVVLVYGEGRVGDVVVIDVTTDKVASFPARRCK